MSLLASASFARRFVSTMALGLVATAAPAAAQEFGFETLGYGGASTPCNWDGGSVGIQLNGFMFWGLRPLDLANYQRCWANSSTPDQQNGYAKTGVVALGSHNSIVQRAPGTPQFFLNSLQLGTGWVNPTTVTLVGMTWARGIEYSSAFTLNPANGPLTVLGNSDVAIDYFHLLVNYNTQLAGNWTPGAGASSWDPYNSRQRRYEAGFTDRDPYLTYYVDNVNMSTVPEPSTYALTVVGLAVLGFVARRRQSRAG